MEILDKNIALSIEFANWIASNNLQFKNSSWKKFQHPDETSDDIYGEWIEIAKSTELLFTLFLQQQKTTSSL